MSNPSLRLLLLGGVDVDGMEIAEWTNEDNKEARLRGWMFVNDPGKPPELISTWPSRTPFEIVELHIKPNKDKGGLESKAYAVLCGMKLKYPEHKFLHEKSANEIRGVPPSGGIV